MNNFMLSVSQLLLGDVAKNFGTLVKSILGPVFSIISVCAVIYAVVIGFQYAKAQDASEREKVKGRLIGALVGAVIMVGGAVLAWTIKWDQIFTNMGGDTGTPTGKAMISAFLTRIGL